MAEWLGRWTCNLLVQGSTLLLTGFVELGCPSSTPWLRFVNSQLVCLLQVGIFNHFNLCLFTMFVSYLFVLALKSPTGGVVN